MVEMCVWQCCQTHRIAVHIVSSKLVKRLKLLARATIALGLMSEVTAGVRVAACYRQGFLDDYSKLEKTVQAAVICSRERQIGRRPLERTPQDGSPGRRTSTNGLKKQAVLGTHRA